MTWQHARDALLAATPSDPRSLGEVHTTGVYAWWDLGGILRPKYPEAFPSVDPSRPLYIGKAQNGTLAQRGLAMHLKMTRRSSLRRSVASLLRHELPLLEGATAQPKLKFSLAQPSEMLLTEWLVENLRVTWFSTLTPGIVERRIIDDLLPPLNDTFAHRGDYWRFLKDERTAAWEAIRAMRANVAFSHEEKI